MSGLYNSLMGRNPFAPHLLACIGITMETKDQYKLGRIRDVYTNADGSKVFILHRNYGADGQEYDDSMATHPQYVGKHIADKTGKETTYWLYEFNVPADTLRLTQKIAELSDTTPAFDRYHQAISQFAAGVKNEQTEHMAEVGKKMLGPILEAMDGKGPVSQTLKIGDGEVVIETFGDEKDD